MSYLYCSAEFYLLVTVLYMHLGESVLFQTGAGGGGQAAIVLLQVSIYIHFIKP